MVRKDRFCLLLSDSEYVLRGNRCYLNPQRGAETDEVGIAYKAVHFSSCSFAH